jgi:hypothetical protein
MFNTQRWDPSPRSGGFEGEIVIAAAGRVESLGNRMKKVALAVIAVVALCVAGSVWSFLRTHQSRTTSDVAQKFTISAKAPYGILWRTGSAYALVRGQINGTARLEVVGSHNRDRTEFFIGPGPFEIVRGGPEEWSANYSVQYTPMSATSGIIYASVYCGSGMSKSDRALYYESLRRRAKGRAGASDF